MSLLEQDIIRKKQVNKLLELEPKLNIRKNKEIKNSAIYAKVVKNQLLGLYYLVSWKSYSEDESIWKPVSIIMDLQKIISIFYKDYLKKSIAISLFLDSALYMSKLTVKSTTMQNCSRLIKNSAQQIRKA